MAATQLASGAEIVSPGTAAPSSALLDGPIAFVDVETTGGDARSDRVIEVGIVSVRGGVLESEWSALVNPGRPIPQHIEALTGIDDSMVETAPAFEDLARDIESRLEGRLFVAHNVSFDRSFMSAELRRAGCRFNPRSLCTVRLSRRLFPEAQSHALDSVIQRLGVAVERRHRALDDARVLWELWQAARARSDDAELELLLGELANLATLPPQLPANLVDEIPEGPGIYRFYGEGRALLYVGKSRALRARVLSHFNSAHRNATDRRLKMEVRDIDWTETAGELGAELAEVSCIREAHPRYNKRLQGGRSAFTVQLAEDGNGSVRALIEELDPYEREPVGECYGLFRMPAQALRMLKRLVRERELCAVALGLEPSAGSCVDYPRGACRGACVGLESAQLHATRARLALAPLRVRSWPFAGAIGVRERSCERVEMHVFCHWRYLGTARADEDLERLCAAGASVPFDIDVFRILNRYMSGRRRVEIVDLRGWEGEHSDVPFS